MVDEVVYAARQLSLDRQIALKMMRAEEAGDAKSVADFLSEAVVTGELDHPNRVKQEVYRRWLRIAAATPRRAADRAK